MFYLPLAPVALVASLFAASVAAQTTTLVSCPFAPAAGDQVTRGFYVQNYAGATLNSVTLQFSANVAEAKTISLTARSGAYNGPVIGTATATGTIGSGAAITPLVFNFGNAAVAPGSTVTFANDDRGRSGARLLQRQHWPLREHRPDRGHDAAAG